MLDKYTFKNYIIEENPEDFFNWCLDNKLYKTTANKKFISRMKTLYEGAIEFKGLSSIIAFYKTNPVGIILCEHQNFIESARIYKEQKANQSETLLSKILNSRSINNMQELDWNIQQIGMVNIFIKKSHRKNGLATFMSKEIENLRLYSIAQENFDMGEQTIPVLQAKELSFDILIKNSKYCYITQYKPKDYLYNDFLHLLSKKMKQYRETKETVPLLRVRETFNKEEFMKIDIKYENHFSLDLVHTNIKRKTIPSIKIK